MAASPARRLPVLATEPPQRGPDRRTDRTLSYVGLGVAVAFLVAGLASLALPAPIRLGWWLPLHLVLAGAAGIAISAMLPFFVAALAVAPPAPARLRAASIVLVCAGVLASVAGRVQAGGGVSLVAGAGAVAYAAGMAGVGLAALWSLRGRLGARGGVVTHVAYVVALLDVIAGVVLAGLFVAGNPAVVDRWSTLRPAHALLNVLGFVTLAVAGTLVHFVPTVVGSRIRRRPAAGIGVALLAVAAPLVAAGYGLAPGGIGDQLVRLGALAGVLGAGAMTLHGWQAFRDRAGWTTDLAWHRFTTGSLVVAPVWLLVALAIAAAGVLEAGAGPGGWQLADLAAPLVLGFVAQVLLGALSHLVPAIGSGTPARHAAQRRVLGALGSLRLLVGNAGVAALTIAALPGTESLAAPLAMAGALAALGTGAASLALLVAALRIGEP
jgi:nitrite reductase (NO-forming)